MKLIIILFAVCIGAVLAAQSGRLVNLTSAGSVNDPRVTATPNKKGNTTARQRSNSNSGRVITWPRDLRTEAIDVVNNMWAGITAECGESTFLHEKGHGGYPMDRIFELRGAYHTFDGWPYAPTSEAERLNDPNPTLKYTADTMLKYRVYRAYSVPTKTWSKWYEADSGSSQFRFEVRQIDGRWIFTTGFGNPFDPFISLTCSEIPQ